MLADGHFKPSLASFETPCIIINHRGTREPKAIAQEALLGGLLGQEEERGEHLPCGFARSSRPSLKKSSMRSKL